MADLSHSLPRPQVSATLSKKVSNGNGFTAKNVYDDVFGGAPKCGLPTFSSRIEDYSEIFGGYHASSRGSTIPILDLPDVDESSFLVDVRSSKFDYLEVFGGSETVDFAVPYEELFAEAEGGESSSEDVWTPAETGSPSEGSSEDPAYSESNQALSNGNSHHSYESVKQVSTFYHKSNQMSKEDGISGTTHVTQLNAVPAFTLVVDEDIPTQKEKCTKSLHQVAKDHNFDVDACIGLTEGKHLRNANSHLAACDTVSRTSESNPRPQQNLIVDESHPEKVFLTVSEINLRTRPSPIPPPCRPPPKLTIKQGESERPIASQLKISRSYTYEEAAKDSSPTFFDVEVDATSSAAASAAAMKEVMEKAQARLKSAKLSMERKREGFQNRKMSGLKDDLKVEEKTESDTVNDACRFKEDKSYRKFEKAGAEMKDFDRDEWPQASSAHVAPAFEPRLRLRNDFKESLDQMPVKEYHEPHQQDGAGKLKAEKQFSELVCTDKLKTVMGLPERGKTGTKLMQGEKVYEIEQNEEQAAKMLFEEQEERKRKLKAAKETCDREEPEKKVEVAKQIHPEEESKKKVHAAQNGNLQEERERRAKVADMHEEHDKKLREARECQEYVNKENGVREQKAGKILEEAYELEEHKKKWEQACEQKKNENEHNEACRREENEKIRRYEEENGKRGKESHEREENEGMLKEIPELEGSERKQKLAWERENNEKNLKEALGREEHDKRAKKIHKQEENEKRQKELNGREENLKKLQELNEEGENEKRLRELCEKEENEKRRKVCEEENEKLKELQEQEENEKQQKEACRSEEKKETKLKEVQDQEENDNDKRPKEALGLIEIERREDVSEKEDNEKRVKEALEQEDSDSGQHETRVSEENGKKLKAPQDASACREGKNLNPATEFCNSDESKEKLKASSETCVLGEVNVVKATSETHRQVEESNKLKVTQELHVHKESGKANRTVEHAFVQKENEKELKEAKVTIEQEKNEHLEVMHMVQSVSDLKVYRNENKTDSKFEFDHNEKKLQEAKEAAGQEEDEKNKKVEENALDGEDSKKTLKTAQSARQGDENGKKREAARQGHMLEEKGDRSNIIKDVNTRQNLEMETNSSEVPKMVERIKDEKLEREKEQEKERLRKIEEDREREREREKDRMAVERITREARERAFAEARERAERAAVERVTAEARQRAMAEARERLEKASVEARLRAERAAVDRATAEAQERAMEKAMAGKAALSAKERVERSVSEKFSTTSRDSGLRQSISFSDLRESQYQSSSFFNGSQRCPDSSTPAFTADKSQGAEAESAQRCKARLERHQRTVQRAAKALAEKNMRDLLTQREQVERNRLAETLDADVKRWSSGKEGNLRALLSTLQYILGPESGWQPMPLTDVITAVAVKKAYRKATLCVHPDKLQQRGASIQQKYICEKVFDLLKEAWNKFNSEER